MAENILETRILLRYGTYSQWMNSDIILKQGEAAIAAFPNDTAGLPPKAIGIKIGNGTHYFDELPWIQAIAADVYNWAKDSTKPSYSANEIDGLAEYVELHSGGGGSGGSAGSGRYQIIYDNASNKYILQQWDEDKQEWVNTTSEINFNGVLTRLNALERWANGARTNLGNIEVPISEYIYEEVLTFVNALDYDDQAVEHQFVTQVTENNGKITVTRTILSAADIATGVLPTERGGTGLSSIDEDELLVGSINGTITTKKFVTTIDNQRNAFATVGAIKDYVDQQTAGLTGAMHYVGEATVTITSNSNINPQINGYNFSNVQAGDVILANNSQEYVWSGNSWRLLGDEGSYAVKGSITNVDIAAEANISQDKIADLSETFDTKVDKVEGKTLSTNDYTDNDKEKLTNIEDEAQVNVIEHVFVNDVETSPTIVNGLDKSINLQIPNISQAEIQKLSTVEENAQQNIIEHILVNNTEINPTTINDQPKSINISFNPYTTEDQEKLANIESGAQVNKLESIVINGTSYEPNNQKVIDITIDQAALNLNVLEGATIPKGINEREEVEQVNKKLLLEKIAVTGDVQDLKQTADTYITLYCGSSTDII